MPTSDSRYYKNLRGEYSVYMLLMVVAILGFLGMNGVPRFDDSETETMKDFK